MRKFTCNCGQKVAESRPYTNDDQCSTCDDRPLDSELKPAPAVCLVDVVQMEFFGVVAS